MKFDGTDFNEEQRRLLDGIVSSYQDGCAGYQGSILIILEAVLDELMPDWEQNLGQLPEKLRGDVKVCMAALQYYNIAWTIEEVSEEVRKTKGDDDDVQ